MIDTLKELDLILKRQIKGITMKKHVFNFDPFDSSGESLTLTTNFVPNGDPGVILLEQKLTLMSNCNSATFNLCGTPLTPEKLRRLANELDNSISVAKSKLKDK